MSDELETRKRCRLAGKYPALFCVHATAEEASRIIENARRAGEALHSPLPRGAGAAEGSDGR